MNWFAPWFREVGAGINHPGIDPVLARSDGKPISPKAGTLSATGFVAIIVMAVLVFLYYRQVAKG